MSDILRTDDGDIEELEQIVPVEEEEVLSLDEEEGGVTPPDPQEEVPKRKKQSLLADLFDSFETFCVALVLMMLIFTFVLRFVTVDGGSMNNTLANLDKLVISDLFFTPETGDIVVLNAEGKLSEKYIIKRVIATGGQTVSIDYESWRVTVDGVVLKENYINKTDAPMNAADRKKLTGAYKPEGEDDIAFTVPEGMLFVMGDNRNKSADSRAVGFFEEERLLGRVLFRISPFESFGTVE